MKLKLNIFRRSRPLVWGVLAFSSIAAATVYRGAISRSYPVVDYKGSSFREVLEILNEQDARPRSAAEQEWASKYSGDSLPHYPINVGVVVDRFMSNLKQASVRTIADRADYYLDGFSKFVHANGVCMTGDWEITEDSEYTGYFAKGSQGKVVGRASVALGNVNIGSNRSMALALKLFPTQSEDEVVETLNMFAMDTLFGSTNTHYLQASMTNNPTLATPGRDDKRLPMPGLVALAARAFKAADSSQRYRPIGHIAQLGVPEGSARAPIYMRVTPISGTRTNDQKDFRREVMQGFADNGNKLVFTIEVSDHRETGWKALGKITFDRLIKSYSCDRRLHFTHPKDDHRGGARPLSPQLQGNFAATLERIQNTSWTGTFKGMPVKQPSVIPSCSAKLDVYFFPAAAEAFLNGTEAAGRKTVSYRHHAGVSEDNALCRALSKLSPVDTKGGCSDSFPTKDSPTERKVPFRTIIPSADGTSAVVSSPSCKKVDGVPTVVRSNLRVKRLVLSPDEKQLEVELWVDLKQGNEVGSVSLTYDLIKK